MVKPGGTVALWTPDATAVDPSVPNSEAIQKALEQYVDDHLVVHFEQGNYHSRDKDVVRQLRYRIEALLHDVRVEKGKEQLKCDPRGTILIFERK